MRLVVFVVLAGLVLGCKDADPVPAPNLPVLYMFSAGYCGPCRELKPYVNQLKDTHNLYVVHVDVEKQPSARQHAHIRRVPTFVLSIDRVEQWRTTDYSTMIGLVKPWTKTP